jgi:hypothetical protein
MSLIETAVVRAPANTPEEIKKELEQDELSPEDQVASIDEPRMKERFEFEFSYTDKRGRTWKGRFTNKILDSTEICRVAVLRSRLLGGVPLSSIDDFTLEHSEILSHLTISLVDRPKWAMDLGKISNPTLLSLIYKEVSQHEAIFHG